MKRLVLRKQSGVLPYRIRDGQVEVLLITSRRRGRWILPKGDLEPDMAPWASAAKEAYEEAGVHGEPGQESLGAYLNLGTYGPTHVTVYPMQVQTVLEQWPEQTFRERRWFTPTQAADRVTEDKLSQLLQAFVPPASDT